MLTFGKESMFYYRRKIILALLQIFNKMLQNTEFQKYLFLFTKEQDLPSFDFVPYKYGCFSFQALYDKKPLIEQGLLGNDTNRWIKISNIDYLNQLKPKDIEALKKIKTQFSQFTLRKLIRYIYIKYPYFTQNSEIQEQYLNADEIRIIYEENQKENSQCLYTIGYEGSSLENYLNRLIKNNIKTVIDVRDNPISMKYGFSKNSLKNFLNKMGIEYIHIPELGITSSLRKKYLQPVNIDHEGLFSIYKEEILPDKNKYFDKIYSSLIKQNRIALTCFEADYKLCHRSIVAEKTSYNYAGKLPIKHI